MDDGSELALVPCISSTEAVPAFLDSAPRIVPGVPLSSRFTVSAWVYPSTAPLHEQARLAALRASDLASVDSGMGSGPEAQSFVLGALVRAARDQQAQKAARSRRPGSIIVGSGTRESTAAEGGLDDLSKATLQSLREHEVRRALGGTDEAVAIRLLAGAPTKQDQLMEMRASLSRYGIAAGMGELQDMADSLGIRLQPARASRAVSAVSPAGSHGAAAAAAGPPCTFDFDSISGGAEPLDGDRSGFLTTARSTVRGSHAISQGVLEWDIEFLLAGDSQRRLIGGIIKGDPRSAEY